jgi:glycosyltransferase involved in cell wall biosynthesis
LENKQLKILWVIPKWTLPANDGARVATEKLISNTIKAGAQVDVLCLHQKNEKIDKQFMQQKWGTHQIFTIPRGLPPGGIKKILYYLINLILHPFIPLTFSSFNDRVIKNKIEKLVQTYHYDVLFLDGLHLATPFIKHGKLVKPNNIKKVVYRAHNLEQDLWKKAYKEKSFLPFKMLLYFQAKLVEKFERLVIQQVDAIAPIAKEDEKDILTINPSAIQHFTPLGMDFAHPLEFQTADKTKLLFIGRLDWPPNKDGLEWILKDVWNKVYSKRADLELHIVGSGNREWVKKYANLPGVVLHGFIDDIKDAYRNCHFTIVPITYGSGTRIKVIESYALGRCMISTKMGAQGSGLTDKHFIQAESTEDWIQTLSNLKNIQNYDKKLQLGRKLLEFDFDEVKVGADFYSWLKTLL